MKTNTNITDLNIENLTSLWKIAGTPFNAYTEQAAFSYCSVPGLDWPNRLWFHQRITRDELELALQTVGTGRWVVPHWDIYDQAADDIFVACGGEKGFEQAGMSLLLKRPFTGQYTLSFRQVLTPEDAAAWATVYPQAFNYRIDASILERTWHHLRFYLAFFENTPIGTGILHCQNGIAGIHGIGVIPEMRRRGFANEIMVYILNEAIALEATHATLQASQMGKGIYVEMGFEEQFQIRNYVFRK
ncbi:GNAT family N-acetyltransferase [Chitinophaga sp. 212800010-3]|uniref:GNAT family N-acetyltransferase n=1 Tax=unclassified Chitinophaga TaxID=2619133 RepID=UPI002DE69827|nr:N-acetyltransferase domain-containing protein [Chitinophaga sp. 212800010-3]